MRPKKVLLGGLPPYKFYNPASIKWPQKTPDVMHLA